MSLKNTQLKVFFCDLTYDTIILVSDTIPINIGFIASYAKKILKNEISVKLFKFPKNAIESIKKEKPDLICLSNYSWNSLLSEHISSIAKKVNPDCITAQGGPNFPHDDEQQKIFMRQRSSTDIFIIMEGEITTTNIIKRIIECNKDKKKILSKTIDGAAFIVPSSLNNKNIELMKGIKSERIKNLDDIPSPYLNGMLDHFFDGRLIPFIETNRGCPFKCSFCHTGDDYFQKTHLFSTDRINEEIIYIAKKISNLGVVGLHIADTNFGMYPRDREITKSLLRVYEKYNWPLQVMSTTGKNNKARVIDITSLLGNIFSVNMSAQSMDQDVLKNIKRSNISLDDYYGINKHLKEAGRSTKAELIVPLPGETKETFIKGVNEIIDSGVSMLCIYTLMILNGTEFKNPDYKKKFGYESKYRIVPLNFGEYDGKKIIDYEEVGIKTNHISFKDYLELRAYALFIETIVNGRPFDEFFIFLHFFGVNKTKVIKSIIDNIDKAPKEINDLYNDFIKETKNELWSSEEELLNHYQEEKNYIKLKKGLVGGNLIYKYKTRGIVKSYLALLEFIEKIILDILINKLNIDENINDYKIQLNNISRFCRNKLEGMFDYKTDQHQITSKFSYDIIKWLDDSNGASLSAYKSTNSIKYTFGFTKDQIKIRHDQFKRYGNDLNALSKIVTRISNLESQFRKIKLENGETRDIYPTSTEGDRFTRYTLAN